MKIPSRWLHRLSEYGMLGVLLLVCVLFSLLTMKQQHETGAAAGEAMAERLSRSIEDGLVLVVLRGVAMDEQLGTAFESAWSGESLLVRGQPADARRALEELSEQDRTLAAVVTTEGTNSWPVLAGLSEKYPTIGDPRVLAPQTRLWPDFLKKDNLLNITGQIAIIAIVAIGMTFVIIAAGIDLSVGSLIALSAVLCTSLIRDLAGGEDATVLSVVLCSTGAIVACALVGAFTGSMVTWFRMPPFIVTLAMMLVGRGLAQQISGAQTISQMPEGFTWLGREASLFGIPNAAVLMLVLYVLAHLVLSRTKYGRYVYATGGNHEAARLSGVPVRWITLSVYTLCGLLAGLGGVMMASQLDTGSHTYAVMYELHVIAAVVVGGASLSGGIGRIPGTLIGAFIIAVIQNGMNLIGLQEAWQLMVMGLVILGAVLLDQAKNHLVEGQ